MSPSDIAAWWGAAIATIVLFWDLYKWSQSGPQLEVSASPNMETYGGMESYGKGPFVLLEVRNNGDRKTTLTHCVGFVHANRISKLLHRKPKHSFIVANPLPGNIPHILKPGERWVGMLNQNDQLVKWSQEGHLCVGVFHSGARREVTCHMVIHPA